MQFEILDVTTLCTSHPELFCNYPLRSEKDRRSILVGETVKIFVQITDAGSVSIKPIWLDVANLVREVDANGNAGEIRYLGRKMKGYYEEHVPPFGNTELIAFYPKNVYRMAPRGFTIWGKQGVPILLSGGTELPVKEDGSSNSLEVDTPLETFEASDFVAAQMHFNEVLNRAGLPPRPVQKPPQIINIEDCIPFITKDGSGIRELLSHRNTRIRNQSLAEATIAPGCTTEAHFHKVTEEIYYILEGEGTMTLGQSVRHVRPGDAISIPPGEVHFIQNDGEIALKLLCCCSPAYEHSDTFLVSI